ncbi:MAG: hypothetical protein ACRBB0_23080 [Pelagimonas sp.]|uniref:hypothetical protein n=1 Tax=Pelagimonas sp. TaxID=2073170 RepID=UPI003D6A7D5B
MAGVNVTQRRRRRIGAALKLWNFSRRRDPPWHGAGRDNSLDAGAKWFEIFL